MSLIYILLRRIIEKNLRKKFSGSLKIIFPDNYEILLGEEKDVIIVHIYKNIFILRIFFCSFSEYGYSYAKGEWGTNNLAKFLELALLNMPLIRSFSVTKRFMISVQSLRNFIQNNTIAKSKKQISMHYDLGNNFYEKWLDKSMTYSSGIFNDNNITLYSAQNNKYKSLIDLAGIKKKHNVLEIGCGWGGFMKYVNAHVGSNITGITISKNQYEALKSNNSDNFKVQFTDYRKIDNVYDRIVSIEMFEAVGRKNWNKYFKILNKSLVNKGCVALQIITIEEEYYPAYKNNKDFIQKYIFPGGMLPTKRLIEDYARKHKLRLIKQKSFGLDYAKTLRIWHQNFMEKWHEIEKLGYNETFKKLWEYYLCYCEAGFRHKSIDVTQFILNKE